MPHPGQNTLDGDVQHGHAALRRANPTHAERQFVDWLSRQNRTKNEMVGERITAINVDISHSPCTLCTKDLKEVAGLTPKPRSAF